MTRESVLKIVRFGSQISVMGASGRPGPVLFCGGTQRLWRCTPVWVGGEGLRHVGDAAEVRSVTVHGV
jgi:hypothetical protein